MAVVIETTIGDFTIDLFVNSRPQACKNFLKLCKMKYYNFCLFHSVQHNFLAQTGDPSGLGSGGESIYGLLYGENARYFETEVMPKIKHSKPGLLSMVNCGNNMLGSQFFITLGEELLSLDGEHCVFGEIAEGIEIIHKLNEAICDHQHRPYKDIRITHTVILEDPFEDPSGLIVPDMSPEATKERLANGRIGADEEIDETAGLTAAEIEELRQEREAKARATILEIVGDLPDADVAPPENVLFVCKLNPVTTDEDLEIIFNRFGKVKSCEIIRDKTTGDSLQYAFVEFDDQKSCEEAYFKMDNVLIDDRRIHVDFSQSTAKERKIRWKGKGKGVENLDQEDSNDIKANKQRDRDDSRSWSSNRRDRSYEDRDRRRERGREKEDDRQSKEEKRKEKDSEERQRRRRERDRSRSEDGEYKGKEKSYEDRQRRRRDRSRSAYRKRDSQHKRDNHWEDEKRHDSKRRENKSLRRKEEDTKTVGSSNNNKRVYDKSAINSRVEDRRSDEWKKEMDKKDPNGKKSCIPAEIINRKSIEDLETRQLFEKSSSKEKSSLTPSTPVTDKSKIDKLTESYNNSTECLVISENRKDVPCTVQGATDFKQKGISKLQDSSTDREIVDETIKKGELERDNSEDCTFNQNNNDKTDVKNQTSYKKKSLKPKQNHLSETKKRKKRRYSSSSDSSSESTDSSESSSSSDSSDYRHSKKKKLIIAKRYYRGGKLIKEIKKKKRTHETSDSESISNESSDCVSKKKHKQKKNKKRVIDDSESESSSDDSNAAKYKKKKRKSEKYSKKRSKYSSPKKKKKIKESSGSSDSECSIKSKTNLNKKQKEIHKR